MIIDDISSRLLAHLQSWISMIPPLSVLRTCKYRFNFYFFDFSDKNRFVTGSRNGIVTIWNNSKLKSRKMFNHSDPVYNATFVQYANNKVFAVAKDYSKLHILDLALTTLKVVDHQFNGFVETIKATSSYIAVGQLHGDVSVFDHDGILVLVSYSRSIK